jgi:hypothetical protein
MSCMYLDLVPWEMRIIVSVSLLEDLGMDL